MKTSKLIFRILFICIVVVIGFSCNSSDELEFKNTDVTIIAESENENENEDSVTHSIEFIDGSNFISQSATIPPGTIINVRISATAGDDEMNVFGIRQDGVLLDLSRYTIDGLEMANNPSLLFGDDRNSLVYNISIQPHQSGLAKYEFLVSGENNSDFNTVSLEINIS